MTTQPAMTANSLMARQSNALSGSLAVPGDKSISHRALMFGALAVGETSIEGLLEGEDVLHTASVLSALGVSVSNEGGGRWRVSGAGVGGLLPPGDVLDFGNSGTAARLMCGILAGHGFASVLTGDASLRRRPMNRIIAPLSEMGAQFTARPGGCMPLTLTGRDELMPVTYETPVASAQVKSAVLLAGLHAPGITTVIEKVATRDHTERMLRHFGATLETDSDGKAHRIALTGQPELTPANVTVPADPSSAAFPAVAALLVDGSEITLPRIMTNELRTGLYETLAEMGAQLDWRNAREESGEPIADLTVRAGTLRGVEVPGDRAASMIDEYPILAMAAACAEGKSVFHGVGELRVKETDRLAAVAAGLAACGVKVEEGPDSLVVHGLGGRPAGGATIAAELDHRIAMSFLVLGLVARQPIIIDDGGPIDTSFPGFAAAMRALGADIGEAE